MKGFLTWHGRVYRKTHNLVEIGEAYARSIRHLTPCSGERRNSRSTLGDFAIQATLKNLPRKKPEER